MAWLVRMTVECKKAFVLEATGEKEYYWCSQLFERNFNSIVIVAMLH
jgi:YHS domain-containing protein